MKHRSQKTTYQGIVFDSKMEARYYKWLVEQKDAGNVLEIECQPLFELQERFKKKNKVFRPITYKADFRVTYPDHIEVVDIKGRKDEVFKLKHKLFEYKYPDLTLRLLTDELQHGAFIDYQQYLNEKRKRKRVRKK